MLTVCELWMNLWIFIVSSRIREKWYGQSIWGTNDLCICTRITVPIRVIVVGSRISYDTLRYTTVLLLNTCKGKYRLQQTSRHCAKHKWQMLAIMWHVTRNNTSGDKHYSKILKSEIFGQQVTIVRQPATDDLKWKLTRDNWPLKWSLDDNTFWNLWS